MARKVLAVLAVVAFTAVSAYAQERVVGGAGRIEIGAFPGGGMFFTKTSNGNEPEFGNYALGGSFTLNVNRWIGFEGKAAERSDSTRPSASMTLSTPINQRPTPGCITGMWW